MHDATSVDSALALLRQHLARPSGIFDPHAALTAVDQLTDVARDKSDQRDSRLGVILRQARPLLVGDKEVAMAKEIQKVLKGSLPQYQRRDEREELSVSLRVHFATSCFFRSRDNSVNPK